MPKSRSPALQLGFCLQQRSELLSHHDVALDLELALHEGSLGVQLVKCDVNEVIVSDRECGVGLSRWCALVDFSFLQVQSYKKKKRVRPLPECYANSCPIATASSISHFERRSIRLTFGLKVQLTPFLGDVSVLGDLVVEDGVDSLRLCGLVLHLLLDHIENRVGVECYHVCCRSGNVRCCLRGCFG